MVKESKHTIKFWGIDKVDLVKSTRNSSHEKLLPDLLPFYRLCNDQLLTELLQKFSPLNFRRSLWNNPLITFSISSSLVIQCPTSFLILSILFRFLLLDAFWWKIFLFLSPALNNYTQDLCFHRTSFFSSRTSVSFSKFLIEHRVCSKRFICCNIFISIYP